MRPRDVEGELVALLNAAIDVPVATRVPNPRPVAHVRVRRIGGTGRNLVQETPMVLVECWAADSVAAFDLAGDCYAVVDAALCGPGSRPSSPVNLPDPETESARYQFTVLPIVNLRSSDAS